MESKFYHTTDSDIMFGLTKKNGPTQAESSKWIAPHLWEKYEDKKIEVQKEKLYEKNSKEKELRILSPVKIEISNSAKQVNFSKTFHFHIPVDCDDVKLVLPRELLEEQYVAFSITVIVEDSFMGSLCLHLETHVLLSSLVKQEIKKIQDDQVFILLFTSKISSGVIIYNRIRIDINVLNRKVDWNKVKIQVNLVSNRKRNDDRTYKEKEIKNVYLSDIHYERELFPIPKHVF